MANDEIKFLPIFQILDIKNIWFLLELEMALATAIKKKFEPVWSSIVDLTPPSTRQCKAVIGSLNFWSVC